MVVGKEEWVKISFFFKNEGDGDMFGSTGESI